MNERIRRRLEELDLSSPKMPGHCADSVYAAYRRWVEAGRPMAGGEGTPRKQPRDSKAEAAV